MIVEVEPIWDDEDKVKGFAVRIHGTDRQFIVKQVFVDGAQLKDPAYPLYLFEAFRVETDGEGEICIYTPLWEGE
jgi:hypothetical protein